MTICILLNTTKDCVMSIFKTTFCTAVMLVLSATYSSHTNASVIASIYCEDFGSGFLCDASPNEFNGAYTYYWNSTAPQPSPNSTCIAGPTGQPFCYESCFEGGFGGVAVVEVIVIENSTGDSDSASKAVNCGTGGGGGF